MNEQGKWRIVLAMRQSVRSWILGRVMRLELEVTLFLWKKDVGLPISRILFVEMKRPEGSGYGYHIYLGFVYSIKHIKAANSMATFSKTLTLSLHSLFFIHSWKSSNWFKWRSVFFSRLPYRTRVSYYQIGVIII